jgi:hypothetical protein
VKTALDRTRDIEWAVDRVVSALMVQDMQFLSVEVDAAFNIADKGVIRPAIPKSSHDIVEFAGPPIAFAVLQMFFQPEIQGSIRI